MKLFLAGIATAILLVCNSAFAGKEQIQEIYTEASGNNHFEAKIKAIDSAMRRAFLLLADKFVIEDENLKKIEHNELKELFNNYEVRDENVRSYSSGASYNAVIAFSFRQSKVNQLIVKYATDPTKDKFFEALVIPVFKINNILYIDDSRKNWLNLWKKRKSDLADHSLYYPPYDQNFLSNVKTTNVLKLAYDDFADMLPFKLYKKVIIPVGEYFTDRATGNSFLKIKYMIMNFGDSTEIKEVTYSVENKKNSMNEVINQAIDKFIVEYGKYRKTYYSDTKNFDLKINEDLIENKGIKTENYYTFLVEISFDKEIGKIQNKLKAIDKIKHFDIEAHSSIGYKVKIYSDLSEEDLTEALYYGGLSFYFNEYKNPVLLNIRRDDE